MAKSHLPSSEYLRQRLRYEPETGHLYWRECAAMSAQWNGRYAGKRALATVGTHGYPYGSIGDKPFQAHRVIWSLYYGEWPTLEIDHINGVRDDNRIANLRQATSAQNSQNIGAYSNSKSGIRGVSWSKISKRWTARIMVERKHVHLGYFTDIKDAEQAYVAAATKLHGEFVRASQPSDAKEGVGYDR